MAAQSKKKRGDAAVTRQVGLWQYLSNSLLFIFFMLLPVTFYSAFSASGELYITLYNLPKLYLSIGFSFFLFAFLCFWASKDKNIATVSIVFLKKNAGFRLLLLFLLLLIFSVVQALVPAVAQLTLLHYFSLFILYYVLACFFSNTARRWVAIYGFSLALFIFTILGIIQFYGFKIPFLLPILGPASTFGYRNPAAHFIALTIPFVIFAARRHWQFWRSSKRPSQLVFLIVFSGLSAAALALLFMNYSRVAIMALLAQILVVPFFWFISRKRDSKDTVSRSRRWLRLVTVTSLLLVIIVTLIIAFPNSRKRVESSFKKFQQGGVSRLLEFRYYHWGNSLMMIKEHPLMGVGLGNWRFNYPLYYKSFVQDPLFNYNVQIRKVHNDYLQLAAECGIPALVLFLILWGRQFYLLRYATPADDDGEDWRLPILASLTAFSVIMFFSFPMQMAYSRMFCFFLLALGEARAWPALLK